MKTSAFTARVNNLYNQLREVSDEARQIITDFAQAHGGEYTINIDEDDHAWVGEEIYATRISTENGNILIHNSGEYSEYLNDMDDYNILDLAVYLSNIENRQTQAIMGKGTRATATPQISTREPQVDSFATESETTRERAKYRVFRKACEYGYKIALADTEQCKIIGILLTIDGRTMIETQNTMGQQPFNTDKPISELTDAEIIAMLAPRSPETPQSVNKLFPLAS